jgi:phosphatidylserine decarboxylase
MQPLKEWLATPEVKKLKAQSGRERYSREFFRDPFRPLFIQPDKFLAAADGIILYAHARVAPDEPIVVVKGRKLTTKELLDDKEFSDDALVIGTYMTEYDVHVNRCCTAGYLTEAHRTPYLFTHCFSMLLEQEDILSGRGSNQPDMGYLFPNERCIVRTYAPKARCSYYTVQIAERDVDEIANWGMEHQMQGERYGMVRFGSQVDVVIPLKKGENRFEILAKVNYHVQAGVDPIIQIKP